MVAILSEGLNPSWFINTKAKKSSVCAHICWSWISKFDSLMIGPTAAVAAAEFVTELLTYHWLKFLKTLFQTLQACCSVTSSRKGYHGSFKYSANSTVRPSTGSVLIC